MKILDGNSNNNKIEEKMKQILEKIVKNKEFSKDVLGQIINRIEIDKDKNILIHFNFVELNYIGECLDFEKAANG